MAENSKQKYNNFLREEVNKYCNENGCYEIYFDYRDEISPKYLLEEFENYQNDKKNYIKFKSYLTEKIYEDYYYDYDYSLYDTIREDIYRTNDRDIIDEYLATEDFYEDLTSAGYKGINFDIKDLLRNSRLCVNVMFGTDKERNFDMGSIVSSYGNDYQTPFEDWSVNEEDYDNALTYLIHQQGHTVKEVLSCLLHNPRGFNDTDKFVDSVVNDIVNNSSEAMSELTALIELSGEDITTFFDTIAKGNSYLVFNEDTDIGIFNEWSGCGGLLEINLDKPFVIPADMVRGFQIEGAKKPYEYTVNEVYGLVGSCWKDTLTYTDKAPELVQENLKETISEFEKILEKEELEQER